MARKVRKIQDASSDDDAPEVVPHSASKANAKRNQKALHAFEVEEKARRKTRNRERDQKLKERARVTRGSKKENDRKGVIFVDRAPEEEDGVEARMLRAMRDADNEVDSEGEEGESEFKGFGQEMDLGDAASDSDSSFAQDEDDEDARMSQEESDSFDPEAPTDDEEMDEDEGAAPFLTNIQRSSRKNNYLSDDLFAAAFASQNSKPLPEKGAQSETRQQTTKKRGRKSTAYPKDLVVGDRTIRTLPQLSDPRSQATARTIPSEGARRFLNHSLAMKGERALIMAKKKGWERRPANVGVMKCHGAPHGFARSTR